MLDESELAWEYFAPGGPAARGLVDRLLGELGAESAWLTESTSQSIKWVSGPAITTFAVRPVTDDLPGLGLVEVLTPLATVTDLDAATEVVQELNMHTTLNRWAIVGHPGPVHWTIAGQAEWPDYADAIKDQLYTASDTPVLTCGASFVVGDPDGEMPFEAILLTVREQIAKVTALMTNDTWAPYGAPVVGSDDQGRERVREPWHEVVHYFDREITPYGDLSAAPLVGAAVRATRRLIADQYASGGPVWVSLGVSPHEIQTGLEIPYGPGPFPGDLVWAGHPARDNDNPPQTSLVKVEPVTNPHLGPGALITMRPFGSPPDGQPAWWTASLLNEQSRLVRVGAAPGFAHGIGAWIDHSETGLTHATFVPAAWMTCADAPDLDELLLALLSNLARLSWGARRVLEPDEDLARAAFALSAGVAMTGPAPDMSGFAAGSNARGPVFGESGTGVDPGARLLGAAFKWTVADDVGWAELHDDRRGFSWLPGSVRQVFRADRCNCDDDGSIVRISTDVGRIVDEASCDRLAAIAAEGHPFAICLEDDLVSLRSNLHVHDSSFHWIRNWPTVVSVAQAITAERLIDDLGALLLPIDDGDTPRDDPDQILELYDTDTAIAPPEIGAQRALALATMRVLHVPLAARWVDGDAVVRWWFDTELPWSLGTTDTVAETRLGRRERPPYGSTITASTNLSNHADLSSRTILERNQRLIDADRGTILGGLGFAAGRPEFITCVPAFLDKGFGDPDGTFSGTVLAHHRSAITSLADADPAIRPAPLGDLDLSEELATLVDFYREVFAVPADVALEVVEPAASPTAVLRRPFESPIQYVTATPRLADVADRELVAEFPLDPQTARLSLRLLHTAIVMSRSPTGDPSHDAPACRTGRPVDGHEIDQAMEMIYHDGDLTFDESGPLLLVDDDAVARLVISTDPDHGWSTPGAAVLVLEATLPSDLIDTGSTAQQSGLRVGAWHQSDDDAVYRVALPPLAFAIDDLPVRTSVLALALRAMLRQIRSSLRTRSEDTPSAPDDHDTGPG